MMAAAGMVLLGLWLTAAPAVLGFGGRGADLHHVAGPLIAAAAAVAVAELGRSLRWGAALVAVVCAVLALVPPFAAAVVIANAVLTAAAVVALAFRAPAADPERYGGGWRALWR